MCRVAAGAGPVRSDEGRDKEAEADGAWGSRCTECSHKCKWNDRNLKGVDPTISRDKNEYHWKLDGTMGKECDHFSQTT